MMLVLFFYIFFIIDTALLQFHLSAVINPFVQDTKTDIGISLVRYKIRPLHIVHSIVTHSRCLLSALSPALLGYVALEKLCFLSP